MMVELIEELGSFDNRIASRGLDEVDDHRTPLGPLSF